MVSLPSHATHECYFVDDYEGNVITTCIVHDNEGDGNGNNGGGDGFGYQEWCVLDDSCRSGGDSDDNDYVPPSCSAFLKAQMRDIRSNIPSCVGDPGPNFDTIAWTEEQGLTLWEWLNAPINLLYNGIWVDTGPALELLAGLLASNNSDMIAAYGPFADMLYTTCQNNHPISTKGGMNDLVDCISVAYYLLDNYAPGTAVLTEILNFLAGTNFDATDYNSSWAGQFSTDVTYHFSCHEIYQAWEEEDCSGTF